MKKSLSLLVCFCLFFAACKRDVGTADTEAPVIKMTSPTANQKFSTGQTITITGAITDNVKIEEVHLEITNTSTNTFITHEHFVPDGATYTLLRSYAPTAAGNYKIHVEADDTKGNHSEVDLTVSAN